MEKMKLHSPNLTQENIKRIRELFPNCVTEARDENGKLKTAIDFDQLKQELSESIVEMPQERYQLNWPGKRDALLTANAPVAKTLRSCREESVDFDTTKNLFIEGDNLDTLKLLQETYLGKVKMIYIDPPYNTGNDFIYEDDFAENMDDFLKKSNQKDGNGDRLVSNIESNGRFHSDWLSFIYPRLKLSRNLLRDDGVIFISIDDNEEGNLRKICDEIFGNSNFLGTFIIKATPNARNYGHVAKMHEYCLMYGKNYSSTVTYEEQEVDKDFKYVDKTSGFNIHPLYNSDESFHSENRRNLYYPFYLNPNKVLDKEFYEISLTRNSPNDIEIFPPKSTKNEIQFVWRWSKQKSMEELNSEIIGYKNENGEFRVVRKMRHTSKIIRSMFLDAEYSGRRGTAEVEELLGGKYFSFPKPLSLLKKLISIATNKNDIILDFFAGSATTAHAVMRLNSEDGGNRKFIMVQLQEHCDEKSEAFKNGYKTIAEIGKERIRRAGKNILENECHPGWMKDIGFRVLKIDSSNMTDIYYTPDKTNQNQLNLLTNNIKPARTSEDLLFQVLLDWGVDLSLPIKKETIQKKSVFFVDENALVACFDDGINEDLINELTAFKPLRVVFKDNGFVSDTVKINSEQIFKQMSPGTEVKSI